MPITESAGEAVSLHHMLHRMITESEQKTEAKFQSLESSIDKKLARLDQVPTIWQMATLVMATAVGVLGIFLAILAFGGDRFDGGVQLSTGTMKEVYETQKRSEEATALANENAKQIASQREQIDRLLPLLYQLLRPNDGSKQ